MISSRTPRASTMRKSIAVVPQTPIESTPISRRRSAAPKSAGGMLSRKNATGTLTPVVLSQEPKAAASCISYETPKKRVLDPVMAKIQKDLNSPSAAARVRATKALKSPTFRKMHYEIFDVPHDEQDLITAEERAPVKTKTIAEVFAKCKIYVEVRTGDDNRSAGIKSRLLRDCITVNEKLYKDTTHVIFKDGLLSTYKNTIKMGIPITSILWFDACIAQRRIVDPTKFKISNLDRYEHPELYKRLRRQKSMQPEISKLVNYQPSTVGALERSFSQDDSRDGSKMFNNATSQESKDVSMDLTLQTPKSMEVESSGTSNFQKNLKRFTTFTPNPMEQTGVTTDYRKTIFTQLSTESEISTPEGSSKTIVFNSMNRIAKNTRRSIFDISMNILDMNCKSMGKSDESPKLLLSHKKVVELSTQQVVPAVIRKRKLFNADLEEDEMKENLEQKPVKKPNTPQSAVKKQKAEWNTLTAVKKSMPGWNKTEAAKNTKSTGNPPPTDKTPKLDRRKTLSYFKTEKPSPKMKSPARQPPATKYIVCTNCSSTDKKIYAAAIAKLGGKVESEVSVRTTHVVSPNGERTMNILRGVIRACEIVNVGWLHDSLGQEKWLETTTYQHDICDSNRVYERSILGTKNYRNSTFAGHGPFYLHKDGIDNANKVGYLYEVITLCSGVITDKQSEAGVIVSDHPLDTSAVAVQPTFIFDSAMAGKFLEPTRYALKAKKG